MATTKCDWRVVARVVAGTLVYGGGSAAGIVLVVLDTEWYYPLIAAAVLMTTMLIGYIHMKHSAFQFVQSIKNDASSSLKTLEMLDKGQSMETLTLYITDTYPLLTVEIWAISVLSLILIILGGQRLLWTGSLLLGIVVILAIVWLTRRHGFHAKTIAELVRKHGKPKSAAAGK